MVEYLSYSSNVKVYLYLYNALFPSENIEWAIAFDVFLNSFLLMSLTPTLIVIKYTKCLYQGEETGRKKREAMVSFTTCVSKWGKNF